MQQIDIKSLNKDSILLYKQFISKILNEKGISYKIFNLPTTKKRLTLLKSPHVNKSAREQFEIKCYKITIKFIQTLSLQEMKFLLINKPKTIKIKIKNIGR